jgi:hypothetical protein
MAPQTEFQKLVGLIRARDELAPLRHVPLEGLRQAVNDMVGARVPEGEIEVVAQDLRVAIEGWLPLRRALEGWSLGPPAKEPEAAPPPQPAREPMPAGMPRVGLVAAACERPSVLSAADATPAAAGSSAWRWYLLLFWAAFLGGGALALHAVAWSPAAALTELGAALSDTVWRALSGDPLSSGAALAAAGLLGVAATNFWVLLRPGRPAGA